MLRLLLFLPIVLVVTLGLRLAATGLVPLVEARLEQSAVAALGILGADWAAVSVDGLEVTILGTAPDARRQRLVTDGLASVMPLARIRDGSTLAPPAGRRPALLVELLRRDGRVTVLGRFSGEAQRERQLAALADALPEAVLEDLSGTDAGPLPVDWGPELAVATMAVAAIEDAFVVVEPGQVRVAGQVAALARRRGLEADLTALAGPSIALDLELRVPRRTVLPFRFAAQRRAAEGAVLTACSARDEREAERIVAALGMLDLAADGDRCAVGLGGPALAWGEAVSAGIAALATLPEARLLLSGNHVSLSAAPPSTAEAFESAFRGLALSLPEGFLLDGRFEGPAPGVADAAIRPLWMTALRDAEGLRLAGRVAGEVEERGLVQAAAARLGSAGVDAAGLAAAGQSAGSRVEATGDQDLLHIAGLAFVSTLARQGVTGSATLGHGRAEIALTVLEADRVPELLEGLSAAMPPGLAYETEVTVDMPAAVAARPLPATACAAALNRRIEETPVVFAPGSAEIRAAFEPLMEALAAILQRCRGTAIEIGGHTDNQGRTSTNERLSRSRADSVRHALRALGVTPRDVSLTVRGYGETAPVAPNDTEAGRARNRRIAFKAAGAAAATDGG
ncbi:MAG: OmpA family protein [Pseudomonadota bacterium]